ncbi:MAG: Gfo/Idh/MocA family oxidoreductase [Hyellaceae cyanobacterium CSU_1_1]|nr:Gfo/Idh/MocA family oxidoreductase [Hyellaceae cyanobacterium CSU_1_1]
MSSQPIRWGIIGTGFIAGKFAQGLKSVPQAQLIGVASRKAANAKVFSQIFQIPRFYNSCEELVQDPDIDVVYIGTPNYTHKDLSILCLSAKNQFFAKNLLQLMLLKPRKSFKSPVAKSYFAWRRCGCALCLWFNR